jgi:hypothetical protein
MDLFLARLEIQTLAQVVTCIIYNQYLTYKNNLKALTTFHAGIPNDNISHVILSRYCHELPLEEVSSVRYIWAKIDRGEGWLTQQHLKTPT